MFNKLFISRIGKELDIPVGFCSPHFHSDSSEAMEGMAPALAAESEAERCWHVGPNLTGEM